MLKTLAARFANLYALWVILSWIVACAYPPAFTWFDGPWVSGALSTVMLGMGLTLTLDDFRRVVAMPRAVALGFIAQYAIMPATAWAVARVLNLDAPFAVGLILVGCCPGGTASNVVTYLAGAHVALSVTLTMVSTVLSVILTPILLQAWAGEIVEIDGWGMIRTTASIVLAPIAAGVYLSHRFPGVKAASAVYGPAVAVLAIVMIAGSIMARNLDAILGHGIRLAAAGFLLHAVGFALGYGAARAFRMPMIEARTVSIEVGMQNSGMAMVLANRHFSPITAAPAVFSSIFHTLVGSLCAAYWRVRPPADASGAAGTTPPPPCDRGGAVKASSAPLNARSGVYYWKCDRPAAFHGTAVDREGLDVIEESLAAALRDRFPGEALSLRPAGGQGNHITWKADIGDRRCFVRVEDGPERDDYIEVESKVLCEVRAMGIPAPEVIAVDASRRRCPFAWQILEYIDAPDLNHEYKVGRLALDVVARDIGVWIARWQALRPPGFGPFDSAILRSEERLAGIHGTYRDYFHLRLNDHLDYLVDRRFLGRSQAESFRARFADHDDLLDLDSGCLVHKDLALWNILGTGSAIEAIIDWDDAIAGDPMDDISLFGCFHGGPTIARVLDGYASVRPLPARFRERFWLHLLRNMIVKSVIRVGAGYFTRDDGFFLIGAGGSGGNLERQTRDKLAAAAKGMDGDMEIEDL